MNIATNPSKGGSKTQRVQNLNISCDNSATVRYEVGYQLPLITNRKSHTGFRLIPTSITLNDLERRNSPYFAFFTEFDFFAGQIRHSDG